MPTVVKDWKEAVFMGYFGPIGVGAIYYLSHTQLLFLGQGQITPDEQQLLLTLTPGEQLRSRLEIKYSY